MYFWVYSNVLVKLQVQSALPPLLNDVAGHNQWLSRQHVLQYKCVLRAAAAAWIANLFGLQQPPVQVNQLLIVQCRLMEAAREERGLGRYNTAVLQLLLFVRLLLWHSSIQQLHSMFLKPQHYNPLIARRATTQQSDSKQQPLRRGVTYKIWAFIVQVGATLVMTGSWSSCMPYRSCRGLSSLEAQDRIWDTVHLC